MLTHSSFCECVKRYSSAQLRASHLHTHARKKKKSRNYLKCTQTNTSTQTECAEPSHTLVPHLIFFNTFTTPLPVFSTYAKEWADMTERLTVTQNEHFIPKIDAYQSTNKGKVGKKKEVMEARKGL